MTTPTTPSPLPSYPEPGPGLTGLEPEIAQIVAALESLGQVQPVLLAAVGQGHEAIDHIEIVAHELRLALATRLAESIGYRIEIE
jgi:ParB-like chromosome segregation protein Spo0J